jgi:hypothetical protein
VGANQMFHKLQRILAPRIASTATLQYAQTVGQPELWMIMDNVYVSCVFFIKHAGKAYIWLESSLELQVVRPGCR